jgi:hypothetical protein
VLGNPLIFDLRHFIASQREAITSHTVNVTFSTQSIPSSFLQLGVPFVLCLGLSLVLLLVRPQPKALLVLAFFAIYVGAFWRQPSRDYYMVAAAVAACLAIGHGFARVGGWVRSERARRWLGWAWAPLALALVITPLLRLEAGIAVPSDANLARQWIEDNIPPGTSIAYVGMRLRGPRIVSTDPHQQRLWMHSFDYGRKEYPFFRQAFRKAYDDYVASGRPRFDISARDDKPLRRGHAGVPRDISDGLLRSARKHHQSYIVLCGMGAYDARDLGYTWVDDAILERQFGRIAILRVPEPPPP